MRRHAVSPTCLVAEIFLALAVSWKVMEFLRILEEYRIKCEEGGDYLEAGRAQRQLDLLRRQETRRQQKAVRARQLCERQDVQVSPPQTP